MYQGKQLHLAAHGSGCCPGSAEAGQATSERIDDSLRQKSAYIDNNDPAFVERLSMYYNEYAIVDDLTKVDDDEFLKIAICDLSGAEQNSYPHFLEYQDDLQIKVSGNVWLDLSHKLAHKGRALDVVQKQFAIDPQHTMVFGDYLNDLEMMNEAHFSFAMENAHPKVKDAARFTTASNDNRGVLSILEQL